MRGQDICWLGFPSVCVEQSDTAGVASAITFLQPPQKILRFERERERPSGREGTSTRGPVAAGTV